MKARVAAALLVLGLLLLPQLLRSITDSFLFHPRAGQWRTPADLGIPFEELRLEASDGVRVQAWWMPGEGDLAVVSFHGNGGLISDLLDHNRVLRELGVSVLALEYRGYGESEGRPSEEGLAKDAHAAIAEAARRGKRVVVHGRSLGGAVAIRGASDQDVAGLIVENTFTALKDMAGRSGIPLATHLVAYDFDSLRRIQQLQIPTLVVHGDADELIPPAMGRTLAAAAPMGLFLGIPGGTHNDTWVRGGAAYWTALRDFLQRL